MQSKTFPVGERGIGAGGCVLIVLVVLVVLGVAGYFVFKGAVGVLEEQVKTDLRDNPVVKQHLGNLSELSLNTGATASRAGEGTEGDDQVMVFDATGTKDGKPTSGELTVTLRQVGDAMKVVSGSLRTEDGTTHDLNVGGS